MTSGIDQQAAREKVLLILILAMAAFFRFYHLDVVPPGIAVDEAVNGNDALEAWRTGHFRVFYPENNGREGLFINIQAIVLGLVGRREVWVLRLPSAILGSLSVVFLYLLAQKWIGKTAAVWATFFMATSFWHIQMSRLGTRPAAAVFFLIVTLFLLWRTCELLQSRWWWSMAILSGAFYGLGFHTYTPYKITPLLLAMIFWQLGRVYGKRQVIKIALVVSVTTLLVLAPLLIFAVRHPEVYFLRIHQLEAFPTTHPVLDRLEGFLKAIGMFNLAGDINPRHNIPGRPTLFWPAGVLFILGVIASWRTHRFLLVWLLIGSLPAVLGYEGMPHQLRSLVMLPAVCILTALGVETCAKWLQDNAVWAKPVLGGSLALALSIECYRSYFITWPSNPRVATSYDQSLLGVAKRLDDLPKELPKYMILAPDGLVIRGLPGSAQPLMFLTDTLTKEQQLQRNIFYLTPDETNQIARGYVYVHYIEAVFR
jgi:4-amino-4-deoxy-L-arabinose transferase-like glycosyltransferase